MRNKLLLSGLILGAIATILGIIASTGVADEREALRHLHIVSTAVCLGLMSITTIFVGKSWKD